MKFYSDSAEDWSTSGSNRYYKTVPKLVTRTFLTLKSTMVQGQEPMTVRFVNIEKMLRTTKQWIHGQNNSRLTANAANVVIVARNLKQTTFRRFTSSPGRPSSGKCRVVFSFSFTVCSASTAFKSPEDWSRVWRISPREAGQDRGMADTETKVGPIQ